MPASATTQPPLEPSATPHPLIGSGLRVLVTGASRGMGLETVRYLLEWGCEVTACARFSSQTSSPLPEHPRLHILKADLSSPSQAQEAGERACALLGGLDCLINNAALLGPVGKLGDMGQDSAARDLWFQALNLNVVAPAALLAVCLPHLRASHGRAIQVISGASTTPLPSFSSYCATKAALDMLTKVTAQEEPLVTCFNYSPVETDTGMQAEIRDNAAHMPSPLSQYFANVKLTPARQSGRELALLALLAPRQATGQLFPGGHPVFDELEKILLQPMP